MTWFSWAVMVGAIASISILMFLKYRSAIAVLFVVYCTLLFIVPGAERIIYKVTYLGYSVGAGEIIRQNFHIAAFFLFATVSLYVVPVRQGAFDLVLSRGFGRLDWRTLIYAYIVCAAISYLANLVIYRDPLYILNFGALDRFSVMMSLIKGGWYLTTLSGLALVPCVMMLGDFWKSWRLGPFIAGACLLVFTYFLTQPPTRTSIVAAVVSLALIKYDSATSVRARRLAIVAGLGLFVVASLLLQVLNESRIGVMGQTVASSQDQAGFLESITANFHQYDNGLLLERRWEREKSTSFTFLAASISPLNIVPSAVLPFEKPRADKDAFLTETVFGSGLDLVYYSEGSTITFAMPMTSVTDWGYLGVAVAGVIFGLVFALLLRLRTGVSYAFLFFTTHTAVSFIAALRYSVEGLMQQLQIIGIVLGLIFAVSALSENFRRDRSFRSAN